MGAFIPKCNSDGTYAAKQCHGSTGYCWCVKPTTGKEISGTRRRSSHVTCGLTACQEHLLSVNSKFMGAFIPKCNSDGTYAAKQCHGSTGYCWCVKPTTGKEISGTRRRSSHVTCATGCIDDKGKRYSPEQSMFDGCNTCTCTSSGHFACTLKACIKKHY